MIDPAYLADLRRRAALDAAQLNVEARGELATLALTLGYVTRSTLAREHLDQVLDMFAAAAPTLALELRRTLEAADLFTGSVHRETA